MRHLHIRISGLTLLLAVAGFCLLGGCGWGHHQRKPKSYDRSISDDSQDPTYRADPERADVEVREAR